MGDVRRYGLQEAVMFVLYTDDAVLLELRLESEPPEWFIPNGGIETKDQQGEYDYRLEALLREMREELDDTVPVEYTYMTAYFVHEIKAMFHIYLVPVWDGQIPQFNYEEGALAAELHWKSHAEARQLLRYPVVQHALDLVADALDDRDQR